MSCVYDVFGNLGNTKDCSIQSTSTNNLKQQL